MIELQYVSGDWREHRIANEGSVARFADNDRLRAARVMALRGGHTIETATSASERGIVRLRCAACQHEACASVAACGATMVVGQLLDDRCQAR